MMLVSVPMNLPVNVSLIGVQSASSRQITLVRIRLSESRSFATLTSTQIIR